MKEARRSQGEAKVKKVEELRGKLRSSRHESRALCESLCVCVRERERERERERWREFFEFKIRGGK